MKIKKQTPPFTVIIEPTEGCNLGCSFCGLRGMREKGTKPWKFMNLKTATRIANEIERVGWKVKIVIGNHGEPTLNPLLPQIVRIFRERLPKSTIHLYTNALKFNSSEDVNGDIEVLFEAGVNDILVDCYTNKTLDFVGKVKHDNIVNLEKGVPYYTRKLERRILLIPPILDDKTNKMTRKLANHSGAAFPPDRSYNNKRCAMPFRELSFRWDGNVALCCDDFRGAYPIGSIHEMDIESLWNHERFQVARIMLYNYDRNFKPCDGCTNISMRVGFLPDVMGKEILPEITKEVRQKANSVHKENGYLSDIIIKRDWEE